MLRSSGDRRPLPTLIALVVLAVLAVLATMVTSALPALGVPGGPARVGAAAAPTAAQGITGTVTRTDGRRLLTFVEVTSVDDPSREATFETDDDGVFRIDLAPGRYWVRFDGASVGRGRGVAREWWGGTVTRGASTPVEVEAGSYTPLDPQLDPGGTISGVVAELAGSADRFARVWVTAPDPTYPDGYAIVGFGIVEEDGSYETTALLSGDQYRLQFFDYRRQVEGWWRSEDGSTATATTAAAASPVSVTAPDATTGVSPTGLHPFGAVAGVVTRADGRPVADTGISLYRLTESGTWEETGAGDLTDARGRYSVVARGGTYRVRARGERTAFWGGGATVQEARSLEVVAAAATTADFELEPAGITPVVPREVRGESRVGRTLTVTRGRWYPAAVTETFQWLRDGRPIAGAVGARYTLRVADAGRSIAVWWETERLEVARLAR